MMWREGGAAVAARFGQAPRRGQETALLLGNCMPSLAAARALGTAGYRVIAGNGGTYSNVRHSRYCAGVWRHPPITDAEAFLGALTAFLARSPEITTIVPLHERYVAFMTHARDRLPAGVILAAPPAQVVTTCLDKSSMYAIARAAGVPFRRIVRVADVSELAEATDDLGYPCVIRPADQLTRLAGDAKALICRDRATVERLVAGRTGQHGSLLVQRYVHGPRHNIYFIAEHGRILALLESKVLRTDRLDGTGVAVEEVLLAPHARLVGYCQAMLERLEYTGIGAAQFIVPGKGEPSFLEINPRHDAAAAGVEAHGLDLTLAAVDLASGAGGWRPDPDFQYPVGRRMAWTSRDVYGLGMAVSRREVGPASALRWLTRALVAAGRADVHLVWDRQDPLPALVLYAHLVTLGPWRRLRRRRRDHGRRSTRVDADPRSGPADARPSIGRPEAALGRDT